jgi:hypothetical protein
MQESADKDAPPSAVVDTSLIDEMLRLVPAERLRQNDRMASLVAKLQVAFSGRPPPVIG